MSGEIKCCCWHHGWLGGHHDNPNCEYLRDELDRRAKVSNEPDPNKLYDNCPKCGAKLPSPTSWCKACGWQKPDDPEEGDRGESKPTGNPNTNVVGLTAEQERIAELEERLDRTERRYVKARESADKVMAQLEEIKRGPPYRDKLPPERDAMTHKFTILASNPETGEPEDVKGYLTIGFYEDGRVGEIFVKLSKQGTRVSGFVDAWAITVSMLLQLGVPLRDIVTRFKAMRFEPSGRVKEDNELALSPIDYICRYLGRRYVKTERVDGK